jgi:hypothetical protein
LPEASIIYNPFSNYAKLLMTIGDGRQAQDEVLEVYHEPMSVPLSNCWANKKYTVKDL